MEWKRPSTPPNEEERVEIGWKKGLENKKEKEEEGVARRDDKV